MRRGLTAGVIAAVLLSALASSTVTGRPARLTALAERPAASGSPERSLWLVDENGAVYTIGDAKFHGSVTNGTSSPVIGIAMTPGSGGYWIGTRDGAAYNFGNAADVTQLPTILKERHKTLASPIVGISAAGTNGYYLVASDGGVFALGRAHFYGSVPGTLGGRKLNSPIVAIVATPDGHGYWEFAADGGVFRYGDAKFFGSIPGKLGKKRLSGQVVAAATTESGNGYWMLASDGGVFSFGGAHFFGSLPYYRYRPGRAATGPQPVGAASSLAASTSGNGYTATVTSGFTYAFGSAPTLGQLRVTPARAIVGIGS